MRSGLRVLSLLLCGLLLGGPTFAAEQLKQAIKLGFLAAAPSSQTVTLALSSVAVGAGWGLTDCIGCSQTGLAYSFIPTTTKQISKIKVFASAVNGTVAAADMKLDVYSDSSGLPGTTIESKVASAGLTALTWVEFTGFTATSTVTAGTQYWIVLRNANETPNTNFPTYRFADAGTVPTFDVGGGILWGFNKLHTTDGGQSWITGRIGIGGWRIEFSDGTFLGLPISTVIQATADYAYGTREAGVWLTSPANATLKVRGLVFYISKLGSTQADLRFRLYTGSSATPTLLATTPIIPEANVPLTNPVLITAYFNTVQTISPSTVLRATFGNTDGNGDTSNAYRTHTYTIDNTAGSKALFGYGGTGFKKTYSTDGVTFTDTDTDLFSFGLLLDTDGEFVAPATTSGGVIGG